MAYVKKKHSTAILDKCSLPKSSGEQILAFSGICLVDLYGTKPCRQGGQEGWLIFKAHLLQAQEECISTKKKSHKNIRRPAWMNKKFLEKLYQKKEGPQRVEARTDREEYKDIV